MMHVKLLLTAKTVQTANDKRTSDGRRTIAGLGARWFSRALMLMTIGATLTACQSPLENAGSGNEVAPPLSTAVEQTFGDKGSEVTLLLEKGANGYFNEQERDVRDGAALAVGELGGDQVFVKVVPILPDGSNVETAVAGASERKSKLLISYGAPSLSLKIANISPSKRPLLINLGPAIPASSGGLFNFEVNETDSIIQGAQIAVASGKRNFVLFVQADYPSGFESRVSAALSKIGAKVTRSGRFDPKGVGALETVRKDKDNLSEAGAALVAGNTMAVVNIASAIKSTAGGKDIAVIGTSGWPEASYSAPAAKGALVVTFDKNDMSLVAERYSRQYKRPISDQAAYGYDIVALAAGLRKAKGDEGLAMKTLLSKSGFAGLSGRFTFTGTGNTERRLVPYSIANGRLNPL